MKTILDDPEGFFENGGWKFLDPDSGVSQRKAGQFEWVVCMPRVKDGWWGGVGWGEGIEGIYHLSKTREQ